MDNNETVVEYGRLIDVDARPDVVIELTEQGPQGTHGERGEKGDPGTVTPQMLDILEQAKSSANNAAKSSASAAEEANKTGVLKEDTRAIYEQAVKTKKDIQIMKDDATRDVAEASQSLVALAADSEKNIKNVVNPALETIAQSKSEADAAITEVRAARDITQSLADAAQASANDAQASVIKTATDVDKIVKIEENLNALGAKMEVAAKNIETSDKSVSENYNAVIVLKDDIVKTKSIIDDQSLKVSDALSEARKIASDVSNDVASAAAASAAAAEAKTAAEKASTLANDAATIVSGSLSDVQTLADKVAALKPAIDDAVTNNSTINDEISTNKTAIEKICADAKDNVDKANTIATQVTTDKAAIEKICADAKDSADKASAIKTDINSTATQITADKTAIKGIQSSINNVSKDITDKLGQVNKTKNDISEDAKTVKIAKDSVENRWNDFSTIYYGASPTPPSGDIKLGALWLDTSETPEVLKKYVSSGWEVVAATNVFTKSEINQRFADLTTDDIKETANTKILTADERNKIATLNDDYLSKSGGTISGSLTVNDNINVGKEIQSSGWITCNYTGDPNSWGIGFQVRSTQNPEYHAQIAYAGGGGLRIYINGYGDAAVFQRDGNLAIGSATYQSDGNIRSSLWQGGHLAQHIENRCAAFADDRRNWSVTDVRLVGWAEAVFTNTQWWSLPTGYFANAAYIEGNGNHRIGGNQIQLYIAARGWFPVGG